MVVLGVEQRLLGLDICVLSSVSLGDKRPSGECKDTAAGALGLAVGILLTFLPPAGLSENSTLCQHLIAKMKENLNFSVNTGCCICRSYFSMLY